MKKFIIIIVIISGSINLWAQGGLAFLRQNPNVRNAGMGNVTIGDAHDMFIYSNPTSFFNYSDNNITSSYSLNFLQEKVNDKYLMLHSVSVGYKNNKNAILIGGRYFDGLKIQTIDENLLPCTIKTYDYSIDASYVRSFNENLSAYITGSFIGSNIGETSATIASSVGVNYRHEVSLFNKNLVYNAGIGGYNIGTTISNSLYKPKLPTSIGFGVSLATDIIENHNVGVVWNTNYLTDTEGITNGFGLEYELYKIVSLRGGYYLERGDVKTTCGLGLKYKGIACNFAYNIGNSNMLFVGLSYKL